MLFGILYFLCCLQLFGKLQAYNTYKASTCDVFLTCKKDCISSDFDVVSMSSASGTKTNLHTAVTVCKSGGLRERNLSILRRTVVMDYHNFFFLYKLRETFLFLVQPLRMLINARAVQATIVSPIQSARSERCCATAIRIVLTERTNQ